MAIAGVDVGTTGCKCTVCNLNGTILNQSYREYETGNNKNGRELNAREVWTQVKEVIREAARGTEEIQAIGVTSFGETPVLLDAAGEPLMNSLTYLDPRGEQECQRIIRHFGMEYLFRITGLKAHPMYSLSKLMWLAEHRKDAVERTAHICMFGDYITYMLTGRFQIDYSLASRTMAFDYRKLDWADDILEFAGFDREKMSKPVPIGTKVGCVTKDAAKELGISSSAVVVTGCQDQMASAIGTGCLENGMAVDGTGTVECITPVFGEPENLEVMFKNCFAMIPFVKPDTYVTYAFSFNGGSLLKWYRDNLAALEARLYREQGISAYEGFNARVSAETPSGLLVLPYFSGAATPYMDPEARGAVVGLRDSTTSIDIYQGLMEGVTFEMRLNLECLEAAGIQVNVLYATGGGAQSPIWLQMKADILNKRIITLGSAQSGTLGCIMLAGVACGVYENLSEASDIFVKPEKEYIPDLKKHDIYMIYYKKYRRMYRAVGNILKEEA